MDYFDDSNFARFEFDMSFGWISYSDGFVPDWSNPSALAMETLQSCAKLLIYYYNSPMSYQLDAILVARWY